MAKFPIYETQRSVPGEIAAVPGHLDFDTGAGAVWEQVGRAGGAVAQIGVDIFREQGEAELVEKLAEAKEKIRQMSLRFDTNTDETTYQQDFDETWGDIEQMEVKNGWARRQLSRTFPGLKTQVQAGVDGAVKARIDEKYKYAAAHLQAEAESTGNTLPLEAFYQNAVQSGRMTQEQMDLNLDKARREGTQQRMAALASSDPDRVLGWKDAGAMQQEFPSAIPTDYAWIYGLAQGAKAHRAVQMDGQQQESLRGLWTLVGDDKTTPEQVYRAITALPDNLFSDEDKDKLYKS